MNKCNHDYENPIRKGRANYVCPLCGADITMALVFIEEANLNGSDDLDEEVTE